jgi:hypothetical protein
MAQWKDSNGELHSNEIDARAAGDGTAQAYNISGRSGGGGSSAAAQMGLLGLAWIVLKFIFMAIPRVIGVIVGFILGLCFKIGIVGKIISTVLVAGTAFIIAAVCTQGMVHTKGLSVMGILQGIICFGVLGAVAFWWFKMHYETIRHNNIPYTVSVIKKCAIISFYGLCLLGFIIAMLDDSGKLSLPEFLNVIIAFLPTVFAFFFVYLPDMRTPDYVKYGYVDEEEGGEEEEK